MRLLDLFCGAGGAAMGYRRAGFEVIGVDIKPQKNYPFEFRQADALEYCRDHGHEFNVIHASPPCQAYSRVSGRARKGKRGKYPDLIDRTREILSETGLPYVMENVEGAPLRPHTILLCGSMFSLDVRRHRLLESNILLMSPGGCQHWRQKPRFRTLDSRRSGRLACVVGVHGHLNYSGEFKLRQKAMGIDWMANDELSQAIPPAYTEYIGRQLMAILKRKEGAR